MFKIFFGDITNGRLQRLSYLGYSLLLTVALFGIGLVIVLAIGAGEHIIGGNLQQAQDKLRVWFTMPFFFAFGLASFLFLFAAVNIMAKRIRDIGLPGWWMVLAIFVLEGIASYTIEEQAGSGMHTLVWLALLLIPTGFCQKQPDNDAK
jgi:uncharacterized membrane protein YhaH (DUF805 family)